jgi:hypothetical protein
MATKGSIKAAPTQLSGEQRVAFMLPACYRLLLLLLPQLNRSIGKRHHELLISEMEGADLPGMVKLLDDLARAN